MDTGTGRCLAIHKHPSVLGNFNFQNCQSVVGSIVVGSIVVGSIVVVLGWKIALTTIRIVGWSRFAARRWNTVVEGRVGVVMVDRRHG
jgi:hypothetical protein